AYFAAMILLRSVPAASSSGAAFTLPTRSPSTPQETPKTRFVPAKYHHLPPRLKPAVNGLQPLLLLHSTKPIRHILQHPARRIYQIRHDPCQHRLEPRQDQDRRQNQRLHVLVALGLLEEEEVIEEADAQQKPDPEQRAAGDREDFHRLV